MSTLAGAVLLAACTGAPAGPDLPDPAVLDPTLAQAEGFSGGAGGQVDPAADSNAYVGFHLPAGRYLLRVACTSIDGSTLTVTVAIDDVDLVSHTAECGTVDEDGYTALTSDSEAFDAPGGDVMTVGTANVAASFNVGYIVVND